MLRLSLFIVLIASNCGIYASESKTGISLESRDTFTRWYEYPGKYWEESFSFIGVRGEFSKSFASLKPVDLSYGFSLSLYTGNYKNSPGNQNSANAIRPALQLVGDIPLNSALNVVLQAELAYLVALGVSDNAMHSDDFSVYFPSIDIGVGIEYRIENMDIHSIQVLYGVSVMELGVETDTLQVGYPTSEAWENSSIRVNVFF